MSRLQRLVPLGALALLPFMVACLDEVVVPPGSRRDAEALPRLDVGFLSDAQPGQDAGPRPDASALEDAGFLDAATRDGTTLDAQPARDSGPTSDSGPPTGDGGASDSGVAPACHTVTFRYTNTSASSVLVTGTFSGWGASVAAGATAMQQRAGVWEATVQIGTSGRHEYKFIVDGNRWIDDPSNPERSPDGFGGSNSVLHVCEGTQGGLEVLSHQTDSDARTFTAAINLGAATETPQVSLDQTAVPAAALNIQGTTLTISLANLAVGIHDVRVVVGGERLLLKVYVGVSSDWRDTSMYFVFTDRFRDGNAQNNAPVGGVEHPITDYMGGDFAGARQAIEAGYFDQLGVSAIWLTWPMDNTDRTFGGPVQTFNGCSRGADTNKTFTGYHGYWPKSGRDVESRFGTMDELKGLVLSAHQHGIRVLLDFAANHVEQESTYFSSHPDWFNQPPTLCRDGHWDDELKEECWFDAFLPDWKYTSADARRTVLDDIEWLVNETGADGLRVDALKHMENIFITELRSRMSKAFEKTQIRFYMIGETFTGDVGLIKSYVSSAMMDGQFDFPTNLAILKGLATDEIGLSDMHDWVRNNKGAYGPSSGLMSTFIGNHDIARFITKAAGDLPCGAWSQGPDQWRAYDNIPAQPNREDPYKRLRLALTYEYGVPGIPLLYYGDEVGLAGAGDPDNRRMMPLDAALGPLQTATRDFVRRLGRARAEAPVLRTGDWTGALLGDATFLAFGRSLPNQKALVVLNRGGDRSVSVPVTDLGIGNGTQLRALLGTGNVTVTGGAVALNVPALSSEIYLSP